MRGRGLWVPCLLSWADALGCGLLGLGVVVVLLDGVKSTCYCAIYTREMIQILSCLLSREEISEACRVLIVIEAEVENGASDLRR